MFAKNEPRQIRCTLTTDRSENAYPNRKNTYACASLIELIRLQIRKTSLRHKFGSDTEKKDAQKMMERTCQRSKDPELTRKQGQKSSQNNNDVERTRAYHVPPISMVALISICQKSWHK